MQSVEKPPVNNFKDKQIFNAAIRLLSEHGISVATAKIASEAGVSNGTLFNYYPTKQILLDKVYLTIKQEISSRVIDEAARGFEDIETLLLHIWHQYVFWAIANPLKQQVASLLRSSLVISEEVNASVDETFSFINVRLEQAQVNKRIKIMPTDFLCEIAAAQMLATIQHARQNDLSQDQLKSLIQQSFDIYWDGIKA